MVANCNHLFSVFFAFFIINNYIFRKFRYPSFQAMLSLVSYFSWSPSLFCQIAFILVDLLLIGAGVLIYKFFIYPIIFTAHYTAQGVKTNFFKGLSPLKQWDESARKHGDAFHQWTDFVYNNPNEPGFVTNIGPLVHLQLTHPKYIKEFYANEQENFKFGWGKGSLELLLDSTTAFIHGEDWKSRRKLFSQAFNFDALKDKIEIIESQAIKFCDSIHPSKKDSFHVVDEYKSLMARIVEQVFFGRDMANVQVEGGLSFTQYLKDYVQEGTDVIYSPLSMVIGPDMVRKQLLPSHKAVFTKKKILQDAVKRILQEKEKEMSNKPEDYVPQNLLEIMIKAKNTDPDARIDDYSIRQEFIALYLAVSSTAVLLSKMSYYATKYPEWRERLVREIQATNWSLGQPLTMEIINKLDYLHAFMKEVIRHAGVSIFVADRVAIKDHKLLDLHIKKGDTVTCGNKAIGYNPMLFPNPHEFKPERFMQSGGHTDLPFTFLPFSAGRRSCLGQNFSILKAKVIMIHFIMRYSGQLPENYKFQNHIESISYLPIEPLILKLTPRD